MKTVRNSVAVLAVITAAAILTHKLHAAPEDEIREVAGERLKALRGELDLSGDQKKKIRGIIKSHRDMLVTQWSRGKAAREAMQRATLDHGPESGQAKAAAEALGQVARDRSLIMAKLAMEIRPILTPEQIRKFEKARTGFGALIDSKLDPAG